MDMLYVSPHLDDGIMSCGGLMHQQVRQGCSVAMLTVFAGSPQTSDRSDFARDLESGWKATGDAAAMRRQEDLDAAAVLGITAIHWPYPDCIYRRDEASGEWLYPSRDSLFGDIHPREPVTPGALLVELERFWQKSGKPHVYAMLSAGHHVDHQLATKAMLLLQQRYGLELPLYEDYPYAEEEEAVQAALKELGLPNLRKESWTFSEEDLEAKVRAVECYRSQVQFFWDSVEDMRQYIRDHARRLGGGQPAERYWCVPEK
jgi:LmbE family N-acetylglucosaminyl deacetylase